MARMAETCSVVAGLRRSALFPVRRPRHSSRCGAISAASSLKPPGPAACLRRSKISDMGGPWSGGTAQTVIDSFAQAGFGYGSDGDPGGFFIKLSQHGEEICRRFFQIARGAQIQCGVGGCAESKKD